MELSKPDLLQLLGVLEGELQAREIVIAVLKAERVKQLLYPKKKSSSVSDPWSALQRDSFGAFDATFDEAAVKGLYSMQLTQLENFIRQQRNAQAKLSEELQAMEERCEKLVAELEDEKRKHAQDTAQGDDVTYLLEKERERLKQEVEFERQQNRCLEKDIKCLTETIEQERLRQKQIVLLLLAERKRLILRFVEEKQKCERITQVLTDEKGRIADMVDGLEEESKKSLQMEAEMERQLCEFEVEREQFKVEMDAVEARNQELTLEVQRLQEELENVRKQISLANSQAQLGEGVRSTIVTMVSAPAIRAVPTVSPTVSPPRGVARAVSPKVGPAPATPAKPPGLIPQIPGKIVTAPPPKPVNVTLPAGIASSPVAPPTSVLPGSKSSPKPGKAVSPVSVTSPTSTPENEGTVLQIMVPAEGSKLLGIQGAENILSPQEVGEKPVTSSHPSENILIQGQKTLGPKVSVHVPGTKGGSIPTSSISNAKKQLPLGRGAPPPIPPNKPVLPPQALHRKDLSPKPPVPPRMEPASETLPDQRLPKPGVPAAARLGVLTSKVTAEDTSTSGSVTDKEEIQVGVASEISSATTTTTITSDNQLGSEVLVQELADFQQILVSMVSSNKLPASVNHTF